MKLQWRFNTAPGLEPRLMFYRKDLEACTMQINMTCPPQTLFEGMVHYLQQEEHQPESQLEGMTLRFQREEWRYCLQNVLLE